MLKRSHTPARHRQSDIRNAIGLNENNSDGSRKFPFPQAGRYSSGNEKYKPSNSTSNSRWNGYINYVKNKSGTYRKRYDYRTLMDYMQEQRYSRVHSEDLWRSPHYPFHAIKEGSSLFLGFLTDLDFGDEVGLVSYGAWAVQETTHYDGEVDIDVTSDPITNDYATIDTIQRCHQAGDYDGWTGMGDGVLKAKELPVGASGDPNDDGDGVADYSTGDWKKQYSFWEATEAAKKGITLRTLAVGQGADRSLMQAIAFAGGGIYIDVPGGATVATMQSQLLDAFRNIASQVPPAKLVYELTATP